VWWVKKLFFVFELWVVELFGVLFVFFVVLC